MFIDAVNERVSVTTNGPLTHAATDDDALAAWSNVLSKLYDLTFTFFLVPGYEQAGGIRDYLTTAISKTVADVTGGPTPTWYLELPKRFYPREIASLSATNAVTLEPAADGQIARLIQASSAGGTNSGQLFLRTSGAWGFDAAAARPDLITFTNTASAGLPLKVVSGDYFIAEWLNNLRDLINQYVQIPISADLIGAGSTSGGFYTNYADAVAAFNTNLAAVAVSNLGNPTTAHPFTAYAVSANPPYSVGGGYGTMRANYTPASNVTNFDAYFLNVASAVGTFNDYGTGYTADYVTPISTVSGASGTTVTGPMIGYTSAPAGGPGGTSANGWKSTAAICMIRLDVSGGFAYTKYT